ncbi:cell wall hydrolase [Caldibacillus lycopersici]|uniref:Cell wall hydrolase n=1 Tax=Perspicuibacillus lycopersici TaxID=1325689 RepID=A0AAE3IPZ7_9BACI|nr:cell wall hydrolase [Perspicuibacillus lycopersici]MCU9612286.1 cell wall hydrolase [Perspicuibacillus lycopersici]
MTMMMGIGSNQSTEAASVYTVKSGDTLYKIGQTYGVSVSSIQSMNKLNSNIIYPGQKLTLSQPVTQAEMDLLARLVSAEAKGEPYAGKVAVATVVLNRVDNPAFPNTITNVIYAQDQGHYAFTPVANGQINQSADADSKKAVREALAFRGQGSGSLYFYNPKTSTSSWIFSRQVTVTIGNHRFAK